MSTTLIKRSLCEDAADYESLLASLALVKNILDCDSNGNVAAGPAHDILEKLFDNGDSNNNALWFSADGLAADGLTHLLDPNGDPVLVPFSCF